MDGLRTVFLESILSNDSVQTLFDRVYAFMKLPLICFDVSFAVVAYAFPRPYSYTHWEDIVAYGRASEKTIVENEYLTYQEFMYKKGSSSYFDSGTCAGFPQACGPVMQDGRLIAYCGIMIEDAGINEAIEANDLLSQVISVLLRPGRSEEGSTCVEAIAERALLGDSLSLESAAKLCASYPPPYVFVTLCSSGKSGVSTLEYVCSALCADKKRVIGCSSDGQYIYLLYYGLHPSSGLPVIMAALGDILRKHPFDIGVSDCFDNPSEISGGKIQSMLALSVGRASAQKLTLFQEHYAEILGYCAIEYFGRNVCRLPEIDLLAATDARRGTEVLKTLEAYLRGFRRHTTAAAALCLHKNTVSKRIQRIEESIGVDLSDSKTADRLSLGLIMHRLLESIAEKERL